MSGLWFLQKNILKSAVKMIDLKYLISFICLISFSEGISSSDAFKSENNKKTQIFIIYGQSNASGRGKLFPSEIILDNMSSFFFSNVDSDLKNKDLMYRKCRKYFKHVPPRENCGFLMPITNRVDDMYKYGGYSAWKSFSNTLKKKDVKHLIINASVGGTSLKQLMKGNYDQRGESNYRYENLIWAVKNSINKIGLENIEKISTIILHGENDAEYMALNNIDYEAYLREYFKDMEILINSIRNDVGFMEMNSYVVRMVVGSKSINNSSRLKDIKNDLGYWQIEFGCNKLNVIKPISLLPAFFSSNDGSLHPDGEHISRKGLDILGEDIAKKLLDEDMGYVTKELCHINKSLSPKLIFNRPF